MQTKVTYQGPPTTRLLHLEKLGSSRRLSPQLSQDSDENGPVVLKKKCKVCTEVLQQFLPIDTRS